MIKVVEFLVREDGYDHDEFVERWRDEHADLAQELPGLQWYSTSVPTDPEAVEYDGVLELGFESEAAMAEAFESDVGQRVQEDAAEFVDMGAGPRLVVEEAVHVDET